MHFFHLPVHGTYISLQVIPSFSSYIISVEISYALLCFFSCDRIVHKSQNRTNQFRQKDQHQEKCVLNTKYRVNTIKSRKLQGEPNARKSLAIFLLLAIELKSTPNSETVIQLMIYRYQET